LECRSLLFRIWKLKETNAYFFGYQGPVWIESSAGDLVRCEATPARIQDTRDMLANHPEATVDLVLEGWEKGAQWAANSICNPEYHTAQRGSQASANVIEQLEALQASRCDLLSRNPKPHIEARLQLLSGTRNSGKQRRQEDRSVASRY
jgi:hypothetical protein